MTSQPKDGELLAPMRVTHEEVCQALGPFAFLSEVIDSAFLRHDHGLPPDNVLVSDVFVNGVTDAAISLGALRRARRVLAALRERGPR